MGLKLLSKLHKGKQCLSGSSGPEILFMLFLCNSTSQNMALSEILSFLGSPRISSHFTGMGVLPVCMSLNTMYIPDTQRLERDIKSPQTGVKDGCEPSYGF